MRFGQLQVNQRFNEIKNKLKNCFDTCDKRALTMNVVNFETQDLSVKPLTEGYTKSR